jgi:hypothetical protein
LQGILGLVAGAALVLLVTVGLYVKRRRRNLKSKRAPGVYHCPGHGARAPCTRNRL